MKKIALTLALALFAVAHTFAQDYDHTANARFTGSNFRNPYRGKEKPLGSPYAQTTFTKAKVANINVEAFMRYNIYADEFEFITPKNDTLVLDKIEDFSNIAFPGLSEKYVLLPYTSDSKLVYGYLINQYEKGDYMLLKKENMGFVAAKFAKTSLERDMPAKFARKADTYYLKNKNAETTEFPNGKKALLKLLPHKKQAIEAFLKENKIDFDAEADLIKIINLLAQ